MDSSGMAGSPPVAVDRSGAKDAAVAPLRILYVEQNLDGTTGGSYRSLLYLLKGLDKREYAPIVAFYRSHELLDEYRSAGCRTMLLRYPQPFDLVSGARRVPALGGVLARLAGLLQKALNLVWVSGFLFIRGVWLLMRERIDVLHLNNGVRVGNELLVASKVLGIPCVIHQRGITPITPWSSWLAQRADHVICVSEAARQNLIDNGLRPDRCTAIHNGINMVELKGKIKRPAAEVRRSLGISPERLIVGLAGMIRPWKGQMVLVQAMEQIHRRYPQALALIMGGVSDSDPADRVYYEEIRRYMTEHGLDECIMLLEYQPNAPEYLQIFDVMVHTAIEPEPFSRVVIEGMALGRPIVASANGGTPEAIDDGVCGLLVPSGDATALATSIGRLIDDPEFRHALGAEAVRKVERRFLIQGHISRTNDVYHTIVGRRS